MQDSFENHENKLVASSHFILNALVIYLEKTTLKSFEQSNSWHYDQVSFYAKNTLRNKVSCNL